MIYSVKIGTYSRRGLFNTLKDDCLEQVKVKLIGKITEMLES